MPASLQPAAGRRTLRTTSRRRHGARLVALAGVLAALATNAHAGDAAAGKARFADACALCHSGQPGDGGGGMGPDLHNLNGRQAATADKTFPYSAALRRSRLVWNRTSLDRFLADPSKVVPGTDMLVAVPGKTERDDLIAYLLSVKKAAAPRR